MCGSLNSLCVNWEEVVTILHKTHADLAADVGSSREVVSRVLRDFVERGLIRSTRGSIEFINQKAIRELSRQ